MAMGAASCGPLHAYGHKAISILTCKQMTSAQEVPDEKALQQTVLLAPCTLEGGVQGTAPLGRGTPAW